MTQPAARSLRGAGRGAGGVLRWLLPQLPFCRMCL